MDSLIDEYIPQLKLLSSQGIIKMINFIHLVYDANVGFISHILENEDLEISLKAIKEKIRISLMEEGEIFKHLPNFIT